MKTSITTLVLGTLLGTTGAFLPMDAQAQTTGLQLPPSSSANNFYRSNRLQMQKVTFKNQFRMNVTGNLYLPKDIKSGERRPAIIVGHPKIGRAHV